MILDRLKLWCFLSWVYELEYMEWGYCKGNSLSLLFVFKWVDEFSGL